MGEYLTMYANSTILGDCTIGENVVLASRTLVKNQDVPPNSIVYGESPDLIIKEKNEGEMRMFAEAAWKFKGDNK
jgi:serine O-acetyltransferase